MVECQLSRIVIRENAQEQFIYLQELNGSRRFPIVIGKQEASEINRKATGGQTPRPMTHDLLRSVVEHLGATIEGIEVTELRDYTFYANLILKRGDEVLRVDCRPSDAIALATASRVRIYVADAVLSEASRTGA